MIKIRPIKDVVRIYSANLREIGVPGSICISESICVFKCRNGWVGNYILVSVNKSVDRPIDLIRDYFRDSWR